MEVYELPITAEESRNYHCFFYKLKSLCFKDWVRAYISAVCCLSLLVLALYLISQSALLAAWYYTGLPGKILVFLSIFLLSAVQRSRTVQLRRMLNKYVVQSMYAEIMEGGVQLKKIRVLRDRIQIFYCRQNEQNY